MHLENTIHFLVPCFRKIFNQKSICHCNMFSNIYKKTNKSKYLVENWNQRSITFLCPETIQFISLFSILERPTNHKYATVTCIQTFIRKQTKQNISLTWWQERELDHTCASCCAIPCCDQPGCQTSVVSKYCGATSVVLNFHGAKRVWSVVFN